MNAADFSDDEETWLILGSGRRFEQALVPLEGLRFKEIDPVFSFVGGAFSGIELELHERL